MANKEIPVYILDENTGRNILNPAYLKAKEEKAKAKKAVKAKAKTKAPKKDAEANA